MTYTPSQPDPRTNAYRSDIVDVALSNDIPAAKYVEPVLRQCVRGLLPVFEKPDVASQMVTQVRYGEFLDVFDISDGFAWVQNRTDRYVGYIPYDPHALSEEIAALSNQVNVLRTFVYPTPSMKVPPIDVLTLGSYVSVTGQEGDFYALASGGYVYAEHVLPTEQVRTRDYTYTAGRLLNMPYLWGGRTPDGIDCSGLVQLALTMAGIDSPRDTDLQEERYGQPLPVHWRDMRWKRGDLVFLPRPRHIVIMTGTEHAVHACGFRMKVVTNTIEEIIQTRGEPTGFGRPEV
ncbi:MAG: C40 family peptidase [Alphaproteobacteria bacterium]|nr:C40 family peptidase [Alphaproteobacteria bacterium]MBV8548600.1 C40 family peptidase [Alphaproteobacteria bacterium]